MDVKARTPTGKTRQRRQRAAPVEQVVYMRLLWVFPLTALAAALAATVVHTFPSTKVVIPQSVRVPGPMGEQPLTLGLVVIIAVMVTVWAIISFVLPSLFVSRPISMFRNIALVMLLLSFILPFTVRGIPPRMLAPLLLMHVAVAAVDVGILTTLGRRSFPRQVRRS